LAGRSRKIYLRCGKPQNTKHRIEILGNKKTLSLGALTKDKPAICPLPSRNTIALQIRAKWSGKLHLRLSGIAYLIPNFSQRHN
jgi:hypothetical protein